MFPVPIYHLKATANYAKNEMSVPQWGEYIHAHSFLGLVLQLEFQLIFRLIFLALPWGGLAMLRMARATGGVTIVTSLIRVVPMAASTV